MLYCHTTEGHDGCTDRCNCRPLPIKVALRRFSKPPPSRTVVMHQICVRSLVALRRIVYKIYKQYPCLAGRRSLPLGLIVNADSMLVWNLASLGIENQRTKCVKMFRSNCIDFSPTTTMYYAYSTIKAPDKGEGRWFKSHPGPPFVSV